MGFFRALREELTSGSATSNRSDTPSESRRPINGRTAREMEGLARNGSTVQKSRGSYVVTRPAGGVHRHDPNGNGTYSCACGC
ncbi:hypothetical protein ACWENS_10610 [Streptomyces sp. NPDC004532]